jgi:hypothetical protein
MTVPKIFVFWPEPIKAHFVSAARAASLISPSKLVERSKGTNRNRNVTISQGIAFSTEVTDVGFQVSTPVTMKNAVFWDVAPCASSKNPTFQRKVPPPSSGLQE